jgi:hypothetical protein
LNRSMPSCPLSQIAFIVTVFPPPASARIGQDQFGQETLPRFQCRQKSGDMRWQVRHCSDVLVIERGRILLQGPAAEILDLPPVGLS